MTNGWEAPQGRAGIAHSIVNGLGVVAVASLHLYGSLSAEWAAVCICALCGIWFRATQGGPPSTPPGGAGLVTLALSQLARLKVG